MSSDYFKAMQQIANSPMAKNLEAMANSPIAKKLQEIEKARQLQATANSSLDEGNIESPRDFFLRLIEPDWFLWNRKVRVEAKDAIFLVLSADYEKFFNVFNDFKQCDSYEKEYEICQELGFEDGEYFDDMWKDLIEIKRKYDNLLEIFDSQVSMGSEHKAIAGVIQMSHNTEWIKLDLNKFIKWVIAMGIAIPSSLSPIDHKKIFQDIQQLDKANSGLVQANQLKTNSEDKPIADKAISSKERNTMLAVIYGMAISKYGYKPEIARNIATGENNGSISADLQALGIPVDSDTIRKYLKEAHEIHGTDNNHQKS